MFKLNYLLLGLLFVTACANNSTPTSDDNAETTVVDSTKVQPVATEEFCYLSTFGEDANQQDSTFLNIKIEGDVVTGDLHWHPFEKDGGHGTVKGIREGNLIKVRYDYMIEGAEQAEEMTFRMDAGKVVKKIGELMENEEGVLVLKDPAMAEFKEELKRVICTGRQLN
ncbi:MAG: hypothetical protein AB8G22_09805 [Saprospiraceae bacterium]